MRAVSAMKKLIFFQEPFQESWLDHAEKRKPALSRERRYPRGATRDEKEPEKSAMKKKRPGCAAAAHPSPRTCPSASHPCATAGGAPPPRLAIRQQATNVFLFLELLPT